MLSALIAIDPVNVIQPDVCTTTYSGLCGASSTLVTIKNDSSEFYAIKPAIPTATNIPVSASLT
jgi:fluoride ion exporter CrcB/FEX